ncbi:MAG: hypothetical protein LC745_00805 [Planctomycetia bacterium]|nr:hypothetical protein [Planctomycetia bacterium]
MNTAPEVAVTLAPELYNRMRTESRRLGVPIEWLVASLVADTLDAGTDSPVAARL